MCINNGSNPDNPNGQKSLFEPTHTNTVPQEAGNGSDGYLWKYLYTISPSDIVKFVTTAYIPLPKEWGDATNSNIKDAAVDGKIETVVVTNSGSGVQVNGVLNGTIANIPIVGDGDGGSITITS